jgi:multimeric flavodoxin WrbA
LKIIAICGSPRRGNCEWMLEELSRDLKVRGSETEIVLLRKLDVKRCTGCLRCEDRLGRCRLQDAMNDIYPRYREADAIVMASPVYFEMISGLLKNFIDRTCPVWTFLKNKPLAGLLVAEEGIGQSVRNLQQYSRVCKMRWVGGVTVLAKNPGDAAVHPELLPQIKHLAGKIIRAATPPIQKAGDGKTG